MIYYFTHGLSFAAVESTERAKRYLAAGWKRVNHETLIEAWRKRDLADLEAMRKENEAYETPEALAFSKILPFH